MEILGKMMEGKGEREEKREDLALPGRMLAQPKVKLTESVRV